MAYRLHVVDIIKAARRPPNAGADVVGTIVQICSVSPGDCDPVNKPTNVT